MGKPNKRHHELCQKYKQEGRREKNKKLTAQKQEKRMAKIAEKRNNKPQKERVYVDPEYRGDNRMAPLSPYGYRPKMEHMTEFQRWTSIMRRVQNEKDAEMNEIKKQEQKISKASKDKNKEGN